MIDSTIDGGKVICFEPHWIGNMSGYCLDGADQSGIVPLGNLQKLFEEDARRTGKDGNIGMKLPIYFSQLGLHDVQCRVSDKVNFLNPHDHSPAQHDLYKSLKEEGIGTTPGEREKFVRFLMDRGLSSEEAVRQYEAELLLSQTFRSGSYLAYAPNMKITFGTVKINF
ncbi:hypothetical protein [Paenibacillus hamazuiensis]|uniref:hypothetical protein n=1 Tax=Paenibacillus hamazuiensis TaxID=2936508 RepID=UPI00200FBBC5|nr:hypothetical protein [Paenibacillus hamazuiensis]